MAEKTAETSGWTIDLDRPRSGPNQGQFRARMGGRKEPFCGKTPLAALSLCASAITAIAKEQDAAAAAKPLRTSSNKPVSAAAGN